MSLENSFFARNQVICIVFHKRRSPGVFHPLCHDLHDADYGRRLPVSFCSEAVALLHQSLNGKARKLFQASQVAEMRNDRLIVLLLKEPLESYLNLRLYGHVTTELFWFSSLEQNIVCIIIFICQGFYIALRYSLYSFCDLIDRISIHFPAELDLCLNFITVCDRHISHVVGNSHNTDMAALYDPHRRAHPGCNLLLHFLIFPVSHDHLALNTHSGKDMTILTAAVCRLILVHKIHVYRVIWNFTIKLSMQVKQRFPVLLKPENP